MRMINLKKKYIFFSFFFNLYNKAQKLKYLDISDTYKNLNELKLVLSNFQNILIFVDIKF